MSSLQSGLCSSILALSAQTEPLFRLFYFAKNRNKAHNGPISKCKMNKRILNSPFFCNHPHDVTARKAFLWVKNYFNLSLFPIFDVQACEIDQNPVKLIKMLIKYTRKTPEGVVATFAKARHIALPIRFFYSNPTFRNCIHMKRSYNQNGRMIWTYTRRIFQYRAPLQSHEL